MKQKQLVVRVFQGSLKLLAVLVAILAFGITDMVYAGDAGCCRASSSGTGIKVKTPLVSKTLGSASIGCNGGDKTSSLSTVNIPGVLSTVAVQNSASGTTSQTSSQSIVDNLHLVAGANIIQATTIRSNAHTSCSGNSGGGSIIQNLIINGQPQNITGEPNQQIPIIGGKIIINEQTSSNKGCVKNFKVTAFRLSILNVANISLAKSTAGVACVTFTCQ